MATQTMSKDDILEAIGNMSVFELAELIEAFKDRFGVTIAAPAAAPAGAASGAAAAAPAAEEKTEFTVVLKAGKIEFRVDKSGIVHAAVGKKSFSSQQLAENLQAFMDAIVKAKPSAAKGHYIRSVTVSSTMGPGVRVDPAGYHV